MSQSPIELKGSSFTLSVVHLHNSQPEVIRQALQEKVEQAPAFLKNAPVVINVATLDGDANWKELQQAVAAAGLRVVGISGCRDERQKRAIARAGLPLLSEGKGQKMAAPEPAPAPVVADNAPAKTRIISTPVRSGQQIHVYGMMRGRALAGASGDTQCQIFCTHLAAELVSIAGQYWLSDQIPSDYVGQAVRLSLLDNALTIQPLN
jgi:septum site-determining protein MinC